MKCIYKYFRHLLSTSYIRYIYPVVLGNRIKKVSKKEKINVVFLAINIAMWRYQGIYDLLLKDPKFKLYVVLSASTTYSKEQVLSDLEQMRRFFSDKKINYIDFDSSKWKGYDFSLLSPDIIFYPQPYDGFCAEEHSYRRFLSKLLCLVAYGIGQTDDVWAYNTPFHNLAWKLYNAFPVDKERAKRLAKNKGCNMVISGYTNFDLYTNNNITDVWKIKNPIIKRLIWAPHFSITTENTFYSHSNFLWMSGVMLEIAREHVNDIQIAFKPHPRLKSELYKHPDWGKEKTDAYYNNWETMSNTFLETGDFVDLFKSSDAMIHDSSSFTIEYLFVNKPVAFVSRDINETFKDIPEFGREAIRKHYIVTNKNEIEDWVQSVLLGGEDPMKEERLDFYEKNLKPKSGFSTNEIIVDDIKKSLKLL